MPGMTTSETLNFKDYVLCCDESDSGSDKGVLAVQSPTGEITIRIGDVSTKKGNHCDPNVVDS